MSTEMQIAIVGVIGTLAGTVLGWLLNNISQTGKLNFHLLKWQDEFKFNSSGVLKPSSSKEETKHYSYKLSLDIYNSSGETKIMRDIEIVFANRKKILFSDTPKDDSTVYKTQFSWRYDDLKAINIAPKTVLTLDLHNGFWAKEDDNFSLLWKTDNVYLRYKNEKNQNKKVKINKKVYGKHFLESEEEHNG